MLWSKPSLVIPVSKRNDAFRSACATVTRLENPCSARSVLRPFAEGAGHVHAPHRVATGHQEVQRQIENREDLDAIHLREHQARRRAHCEPLLCSLDQPGHVHDRGSRRARFVATIMSKREKAVSSLTCRPAPSHNASRPLSTLRTPRHRDARKTRFRLPATALAGRDFTRRSSAVCPAHSA
jgi:hypothetical protein